MNTASWDDIPSLIDIKVDWDYEPENPLGKRAMARIGKNSLNKLLNFNEIPVRLIFRYFEETGNLIDISSAGLAVFLPETDLTEGTQIKIHLFLGRKKIHSRAVIRNIHFWNGQIRVGLEFIEPAQEDSSFINGLIATKAYGY